MSRYLTEAIIEKHASTAFENSMRFYGSRWTEQGEDIKGAWRRTAHALLGEIVDLIAAEVKHQHGQPRALDALDAVLAYHCPGEGSSQGYTPSGYGDVEPYCAGCEASDEYAVAWPCPTVRRIQDALGVES